MLNYCKYWENTKLFGFDMIVYLEFLKDSIKKHNGVKIKLDKMAGHQVTF